MIKFTDFKVLKKIGQGSFGMILLALDLRNPEKQKHYALKTFKKNKLLKNK
jgi:serine/threonine protein kinase